MKTTKIPVVPLLELEELPDPLHQIHLKWDEKKSALPALYHSSTRINIPVKLFQNLIFMPSHAKKVHLGFTLQSQQH